MDREPRIIDHYLVMDYVVPSSSNLASLFLDLGTRSDRCFYWDHEPQNTPMTVSGLSWFGLNANTKCNWLYRFSTGNKKKYFFSRKKCSKCSKCSKCLKNIEKIMVHFIEFATLKCSKTWS